MITLGDAIFMVNARAQSNMAQNVAPAHDIINFNIAAITVFTDTFNGSTEMNEPGPPFDLIPTAYLPAVMAPVTIDATSMGGTPGNPMVLPGMDSGHARALDWVETKNQS
jgi:hypothetical protein